MGKKLQKTERKVRCDKEHACAPTLPDEIFESVHRLAVILNGEQREINERIAHVHKRVGAKTIGEALVLLGLDELQVMDDCSQHFYYDLTWNNVTFFGDKRRGRYRPKNGPVTARLHMDFQETDYQRIELVAAALACAPATACSLILQRALKNQKCFLQVVAQFADDEMDDDRRTQLVRLLRALNIHSEQHDGFSVALLLAKILAECAVGGARSVKALINDLMQ